MAEALAGSPPQLSWQQLGEHRDRHRAFLDNLEMVYKALGYRTRKEVPCRLVVEGKEFSGQADFLIEDGKRVFVVDLKSGHSHSHPSDLLQAALQAVAVGEERPLAGRTLAALLYYSEAGLSYLLPDPASLVHRALEASGRGASFLPPFPNPSLAFPGDPLGLGPAQGQPPRVQDLALSQLESLALGRLCPRRHLLWEALPKEKDPAPSGEKVPKPPSQPDPHWRRVRAYLEERFRGQDPRFRIKVRTSFRLEEGWVVLSAQPSALVREEDRLVLAVYRKGWEEERLRVREDLLLPLAVAETFRWGVEWVELLFLWMGEWGVEVRERVFHLANSQDKERLRQARARTSRLARRFLQAEAVPGPQCGRCAFWEGCPRAPVLALMGRA
ncbi:PD-(D/E)XK nuclease family protein [Thermus filiformis]|uniref:PD-(D/E)XK endonuclease-like domain-containing protein n=1 Tax=Thermus filiformis TaxID=276 RepID=A0A0D6XAU0_THEFI|nr:PD-(D/E)XK nuclease family protein [Thermus filiformis]KIX84812.1 hypothetical protein THFILI_00550 [Thermus filiformis]